MSNAAIDRLGQALVAASVGAYKPSPKLQEALRHLHAHLSTDAPAPTFTPTRVAVPDATADDHPTSTPRLLVYSSAPTLRLYLSACLSASYSLDETSEVMRHVSAPSFMRPDLIVTDLVTLERTRFSLFDLRGANGVLADVPLLLLSQEPSHRLPCCPSIGPSTVLSIPVMPETLREAVCTLTTAP